MSHPDTGITVQRHVPSHPTTRPDITVVVPAYNYARYLPDAVNSALRQHGVDVTVRIIDDASTDDTPRVAAELQSSDHRVVYERNAENRGHLPTVNSTFATVSTTYLVKLDADDVLAPGALARSSALMERHPEVTFTYGLPVHFTDQPPAAGAHPDVSWTVWRGPTWFARRCHAGTNVVSQPEVLMRTTAVQAVAPVREYLPHTSDMHLWLQLSAIGDVGRINGPPQGFYRVHDQSMQRTTHAGYLFGLRARRDAYESVFEAEGASVPGAVDLHEAARRALAVDALTHARHIHDRGRTADEPVEGLMEFATETFPGAAELLEWSQLMRRLDASDPVTPKLRRVADAVAGRVRYAVGHRRWERTGEW